MDSMLCWMFLNRYVVMLLQNFAQHKGTLKMSIYNLCHNAQTLCKICLKDIYKIIYTLTIISGNIPLYTLNGKHITKNAVFAVHCMK